MNSRVISLSEARARREERVPHLIHSIDSEGCLVIEHFAADGKLIETYVLGQADTEGLLIELVSKVAARRKANEQGGRST